MALTKKDLVELRADIRSDMDERFAAQDRRIDAKFETQDRRIDAKFEAQDARIDEKFEAQDRRVDARFWAFDQNMDVKLEKFGDKLKTEIVTEVVDQMTAVNRQMLNTIGPVVQNHERRISRLEDKRV